MKLSRINVKLNDWHLKQLQYPITSKNQLIIINYFFLVVFITSVINLISAHYKKNYNLSSNRLKFM